VKIAVSSMAFESLDEIFDFFERHPGIYLELGVDLGEEEVEAIARKRIPASSLHIPCPFERLMPNMASFDPQALETSLEIINRSLDAAAVCKASVAVLHPGYATDSLLPSDPKNRDAFLKEISGETTCHILDEASVTTSAEYPLSSEYKLYMAHLAEKARLAIDMAKRRGIAMAFENLNPRYLYLCQSPRDMRFLSDSVDDISFCLDIGHLWISSCAHGFDFYAALSSVLDTGKVTAAHLSNNSTEGMRFSDDHRHLREGKVDVKKCLEAILPYKPDFLVIEVKGDPTSDVDLLASIVTS
jgi:sugar phosphate isomerase/epimerase